MTKALGEGAVAQIIEGGARDDVEHSARRPSPEGSQAGHQNVVA
jgi:hypothetical protein